MEKMTKVGLQSMTVYVFESIEAFNNFDEAKRLCKFPYEFMLGYIYSH